MIKITHNDKELIIRYTTKEIWDEIPTSAGLGSWHFHRESHSINNIEGFPLKIRFIRVLGLDISYESGRSACNHF